MRRRGIVLNGLLVRALSLLAPTGVAGSNEHFSTEDNAEVECESILGRALEFDPKNPEVHQLFANLRLSQGRPEDATASMERNLEIWFKQLEHEPLIVEVIDDNQIAQEKDDELPSFEFRVNTAKLLIELGQFDKAMDILDRLLKEDEEAVVVWYLYGWTYCLQQDYANSKECLHNALRVRISMNAFTCKPLY